MTWNVDFTTSARADLVGLETEAAEAVTDFLVACLEDGPPRTTRREVGGIDVFEEVIGERYLLGYLIDEDRQRFVLLWLRRRPGPPA